MSSISRSGWAFVALIFVYSFVPSIFGLTRVVELSGGPAIAPPNPRAMSAPTPIVIHILSSSLFCLLGALQFLPSLRHAHPFFHRLSGRLVALAGALSALSGLWMTFAYAFPSQLQGPALFWARLLLSSAMLALIAWGVVAIRRRNFHAHGAAMIRAYAIGQGASTQAVFGIFWMILWGVELMGPARDIMMLAAWGVNLIAAEVVITARFRATRRGPRTSRLPSQTNRRRASA
ncbi:MAG: DUF2306 domain-containing protein, partial [Boseongicola sp. SB0664_bin_43]|nr:DUF2306 domain-containing protein [Boseongicola sp. SB0664_bin_43]